MSSDNRLSPAKSLLTTSCIFFNNNMYPIQQHQAFNDIPCYKFFSIYMYEYRDFHTKKIYINICVYEQMILSFNYTMPGDYW